MCSDIPTQNIACRACYTLIAPGVVVSKVAAVWILSCPFFCCPSSQLYDISVVNRRTDKPYSLKMLQCEVIVLTGSICLDFVPIFGSIFNQNLDYKIEPKSEKQKSLLYPLTFISRLMMGDRVWQTQDMGQKLLDKAKGLNEARGPNEPQAIVISGGENIYAL